MTLEEMRDQCEGALSTIQPERFWDWVLKLVAVAEAAKSGSSNRISDALAALEAP